MWNRIKSLFQSSARSIHDALAIDTMEKGCQSKIRWVAESIYESEEFRRRAKISADELGPETIEQLSKMFHAEHSPPKELEEKFSGLGAWISARQFAIFEMFYNFGENAIPALRRVAYGEYDWTQGNAIEVLCRLAADGSQRDDLVGQLRQRFPNIRFEAQLYAIQPLLKQSEHNPNIKNILSELEDLPEYQDVLQELSEPE